MKIRTITYGMRVEIADFHNNGQKLLSKIRFASLNLSQVRSKLIEIGYDIQTLRLSFNQLEDWLDLSGYENKMGILISVLEQFESINLISLGCCSTINYIHTIPNLLSMSPKFVSSVHLPMDSMNTFTIPDYSKCLAAANVCLQLSTLEESGGANFRFGIGFNCVSGMPFYPISFHSRYILMCIYICMFTMYFVYFIK